MNASSGAPWTRLSGAAAPPDPAARSAPATSGCPLPAQAQPNHPARRTEPPTAQPPPAPPARQAKQAARAAPEPSPGQATARPPRPKPWPPSPQAEVYGVTECRVSEDFLPLSEIMLDEIEAIGSRGGVMTGVPTGFADLDALTNGLHAGQLIVIAARPAVGKALAVDTPLPTPTGWTTMGDVAVGDRLIGANGQPVIVVAGCRTLDRVPKGLPSLQAGPTACQHRVSTDLCTPRLDTTGSAAQVCPSHLLQQCWPRAEPERLPPGVGQSEKWL